MVFVTVTCASGRLDEADPQRLLGLLGNAQPALDADLPDTGVGLATAHARMEGLRRQCATQIVMLDGDGQDDPAEIPAMLALLADLSSVSLALNLQPADAGRIRPGAIVTVSAPGRQASGKIGFVSPALNLKPLRLRKTDVEPFTLEQVQQMLATVRADWRNYFTVRFFTGMRTGEAHGLKWKYVDFERRLILVREAIVLCHYQELTNIEAAGLMSVSVEALESLLSRGRRTLRTALADIRPGAEGA